MLTQFLLCFGGKPPCQCFSKSFPLLNPFPLLKKQKVETQLYHPFLKETLLLSWENIFWIVLSDVYRINIFYISNVKFKCNTQLAFSSNIHTTAHIFTPKIELRVLKWLLIFFFFNIGNLNLSLSLLLDKDLTLNKLLNSFWICKMEIRIYLMSRFLKTKWNILSSPAYLALSKWQLMFF